MNSDVLESKWQKLKGEIRSQWGKLTDDDLERIAGNKDKLDRCGARKIRLRLGRGSASG